MKTRLKDSIVGLVFVEAQMLFGVLILRDPPMKANKFGDMLPHLSAAGDFGMPMIFSDMFDSGDADGQPIPLSYVVWVSLADAFAAP